MNIDLIPNRQKLESAMNVRGFSDLRRRAVRDIFDKMERQLKELWQRATTAEETVTFMPEKEQSLEDWRLILAACANVIETNAEAMRAISITVATHPSGSHLTHLAKETRTIAWQMQCALNHPDFPRSVKEIPTTNAEPSA